MATSAKFIPSGSTAAILLALATLLGSTAQPVYAANSEPTGPAVSSVTAGGVTLHSVSVEFPQSDRTFTGGAAAAAINNGCLLCHSAGMVLTQPVTAKAAWKPKIEEMLDAYQAPIPPADVDAIADYLAGLQLAKSATVYEQNVTRRPDPDHGAVIAAQGKGGAPACAQCHAFDGVSDSSGAFPRLAGQWRHYQAEQMRDFASGDRENALMSPIAKALSPDDIADVSAYYADVNAPFLPLAPADPALIRRGEQLANAGDAAKNVPACETCHGSRGAGEAPAIPYLGGQYAHYIAFELKMWQGGYRKNSPGTMVPIAGVLDDRDIAAVAAYYQQLRSSSPATPQPRR